jgi:hypothetical protein
LNSLNKALAELQAYVKEFHTTGLVWNTTKEGGNAINLANSKDLELIKTTTTATGMSKQIILKFLNKWTCLRFLTASNNFYVISITRLLLAVK